MYVTMCWKLVDLFSHLMQLPALSLPHMMKLEVFNFDLQYLGSDTLLRWIFSMTHSASTLAFTRSAFVVGVVIIWGSPKSRCVLRNSIYTIRALYLVYSA